MRPSLPALRDAVCRVSCVLLLLCSFACRAEPPPQPRSVGPALQYVEYVTQGADAERELPLLIVLHGLGDTPEHIAQVFQDLAPATRIIAVRAPDPWGEGSSWYPFPENPSAVIRARAQRVADLITQLRSQRKTRGRPIVTGFSQGGVLSFVLAAEHGDLIAAAYPIAGMLPTDIAPHKPAGKSPIVRAFHGHDDVRIPYAAGERSVQALKEAGFDASVRGFPGLGHGISGEMQAEIFASLRTLLTP
jgi:phospholipase/carboxylesterase